MFFKVYLSRERDKVVRIEELRRTEDWAKPGHLLGSFEAVIAVAGGRTPQPLLW